MFNNAEQERSLARGLLSPDLSRGKTAEVQTNPTEGTGKTSTLAILGYRQLTERWQRLQSDADSKAASKPGEMD